MVIYATQTANEKTETAEEIMLNANVIEENSEIPKYEDIVNSRTTQCFLLEPEGVPVDNIETPKNPIQIKLPNETIKTHTLAISKLKTWQKK